ERCQRSEVVAAFPGYRERGGVLDGRSSPSGIGRRAGLAAGAARRRAGPDVAGGGGRAGRAWRSGELRRVWRLLKAEAITVKKKPVRRRAGSPRRGPPAPAVEEASEPAWIS